MFTVALFIHNGQQAETTLKCPSTNEWINNGNTIQP